MKILIVYGMLAYASLSVYGAQPRGWPTVEPTETTVRLSLPNIDDSKRSNEASGTSSVDVVVRTKKGDPAYNLECGTPDRSSAATFEYSGDFQCRMIPWGNEGSTLDLLSEVPDRSHDWQSRARFFASEVWGSCGEIPELGRMRSFRLRSLKVTLTMFDIQVDKSGRVPTLRAFTFTVIVVADSSATSNVAQAPRIDPKWRSANCPLDDSVPVHFRR